MSDFSGLLPIFALQIIFLGGFGAQVQTKEGKLPAPRKHRRQNRVAEVLQAQETWGFISGIREIMDKRIERLLQITRLHNPHKSGKIVIFRHF